MRLIYFGTGAFALPALRALAPHVCLVVTQPDRPAGRGFKTHPSPAKLLAQELGIPCETPEKARAAEFVELLEGLDADALVVASYGQILSQRVLDSAKHGGINLHGSILPQYRGAAPIQRGILAGDTVSGVTLMQMDKGMDTGDVIHIEELPILPDETYGELQDRLALLAAEMAVEWMPKIVAGDYTRTPQDHEKATHSPKVERSEAELSCARPAGVEYNRFRAFTPNPGAFIQTEMGRVKLVRMGLAADVSGEPGTILAVNPELTVAFEGGALQFLEVQPEGKKRMSGRDYANGARLKPGMRFAI